MASAAYARTEEPRGGYSEDRLGERERRLLDAARVIIDRLSRLADEQVRAKKLIEQDWLDSTLAYHGKYEDSILKDLDREGRSTAFVKLTRHKTNSWKARIGDILFPTDSKNYGITPTPIPKLAEQAQAAMEKTLAAVEAANASTDPEQQDRVKEIADTFAQAARQARAGIEEAQKRCKRMEQAIDDQLVESDYVAQCRDVIDDGCKLGTGILKGPITSQRLRQQWQEQDGRWQLVAVPDPIPEFRRVDPWQFFPDMSAQRIGEAEFTFERHLPTAKDLKRLARKLGFNKDAVKRLLEEGVRPLNRDVDHLVQLRAITGEGDPVTNRFVMWEYHGALECSEIAMLLRAAGQKDKADRFEIEKDPLDDYRVIIHFCNSEVLKIAPEYPLDSGESLYSVWNFQKGETSMFGVGVPHIMGDTQRALNAAFRMMMDNAALSIAGQIVINKTMITPQPGPDGSVDWGLRPFKVWLYSTTAGVAPNAKPFEVFEIPIRSDQIQQIIELCRIFADEETGMPQIAQGDQGEATKTAGGMSMLQNAANVIFRDVVKAWDDDLTKPTIRRAYDWNMQFNPDDSIKGDMQVDARGTSVLLVREIQSQHLMNLMTNWSTHPIIGPWMQAKKEGIRPGLEKTVQTLMIDPDEIFATVDEFAEHMRKQAEQAEEGPADPNEIKLAIVQMQLEWEQQKLAMEMDFKVGELAAQTGMTEQEVRAKYGLEQIKVDAQERIKGAEIGSKERIKAAEIAIEDKRAREAQAAGESESEAVGKGIG